MHIFYNSIFSNQPEKPYRLVCPAFVIQTADRMPAAVKGSLIEKILSLLRLIIRHMIRMIISDRRPFPITLRRFRKLPGIIQDFFIYYNIGSKHSICIRFRFHTM